MSRQLDYLTTHTSLSPIRRGFAPGFVNFKKGCTRLAAASDNVYQLLAHDRWFSPGTPASSTTKTGHHDIAEILLKVALYTKNQSINQQFTLQLTIPTAFTLIYIGFFLLYFVIDSMKYTLLSKQICLSLSLQVELKKNMIKWLAYENTLA